MNAANKLRDLILLVGRILMALPLIKFGSDKVRNFDRVAEWMQSIHIPAPALTLGVANSIELIGAFLLILGFRTRWAALVIALYLIPVHIVIHNFWGANADPGEVDDFGKGMMIMGGLLFVFISGAGAISLDALLRSRKPRAPEAGAGDRPLRGAPGGTGAAL